MSLHSTYILSCSVSSLFMKKKKKQSAFKDMKEIEKKKTVKLKKLHFYLHISNSMNRFFFLIHKAVFSKSSLYSFTMFLAWH